MTEEFRRKLIAELPGRMQSLIAAGVLLLNDTPAEQRATAHYLAFRATIIQTLWWFVDAQPEVADPLRQILESL